MIYDLQSWVVIGMVYFFPQQIWAAKKGGVNWKTWWETDPDHLNLNQIRKKKRTDGSTVQHPKFSAGVWASILGTVSTNHHHPARLWRLERSLLYLCAKDLRIATNSEGDARLVGDRWWPMSGLVNWWMFPWSADIFKTPPAKKQWLLVIGETNIEYG